jgi:hypothetical protein
MVIGRVARHLAEREARHTAPPPGAAPGYEPGDLAVLLGGREL